MAELVLALVFSPLLGALAVGLAGSRRADLCRQLSLFSSLITVALAWEIIGHFEPRHVSSQPARLFGGGVVQPQFAIRCSWMSLTTPGASAAGQLEFFLGVDGLSVWLILLTAVLGVVAVLASWTTIIDRVAEYHALLLVLQTGLLGAFCSFDIILFYVFFEFTLIPLYLIVSAWGGPERQPAARKFFFYTLAASVLTLVGLLALAVALHQRTGRPLTFSIPDLSNGIHQQMRIAEGLERSVGPGAAAEQALGEQIDAKRFWYATQLWVFAALAIGFAVKVPLIPFHTWLPKAYGEAPTVGTMLMAGVLSKLGCYGFLRLCVPLLPYACWNVGLPLIGALAAVGIIYGALAALAQRDMKLLIAYSSISHLGFIVLGTFALTTEGIAGATLQMLNHGLIIAALFLLVGMVSWRYGTREISELGGLAQRIPALAFLMFFFALASVGLPGLNGFVGEMLILAGAFRRHMGLAAVAALGIVLGAWYMLAFLQKVWFGPSLASERGTAPDRDATPLELTTLLPIAALCLWIGLYPRYFVDRVRGDATAIAHLYADPGHLQPPGQTAAAARERAK